jgi:hypothetical protein
MAIENFIPSVWAGTLLQALDTALVYANPGVINRDYEGDIQNAGDTVRINMLGDVTISSYTKNLDISSPEALTDAQLILKVDQQKYYNFQIDNVDAAQQKPKVMTEAMRRAAYGLRKVIDGYIASLYTDISATNVIGSDGSPITGTWGTAGTLAYDRLVDLGVLLDNTDTPDDGRWVVVPPWFEAYLLKDQRFVGYGTPGQMELLMNGFRGESITQPNNGGPPGNMPVGRAAGFDIYKSNQVPNTSAIKYKIIAGHPMAWSFAQQVLKTEAYTPEKRFADALKGLAVYGAKVLRPANLAVLTGNPT